MNTPPIPAQKLLRIHPGFSFDYQFKYLLGASGPLDLTNYGATWTINWIGGQVIYTKQSAEFGAVTGQLGTIRSFPGNIQPGIEAEPFHVNQSGVYFGGEADDPTTGLIDLIITPSDSMAITWPGAKYTLSLTDPTNNTSTIMIGGFGLLPTT